MADIGRILFLPPATIPGRPSSIQTSDNQSRIAPADAAAAVDDATAGRAKQFRFRVYDGRRPDESLAGDNGLPAQRTGNADGNTATSAGTGTRAGVGQTGRVEQGSAGIVTASAPFLAQLIAQEQLRPGLYDPPLRAADRAYRQAGGEPALQDGTAQARFQIAV